MTQEWFESADLEKKPPLAKADTQPDELDTTETKTEPSQETPLQDQELESPDEEISEVAEETEIEELGRDNTESDSLGESIIKEEGTTGKTLESPYIPETAPSKTARLKEEIALFWAWLLDAIREPTASKATDQKHSYSAFALLTLFSSFSLLFSIYHSKYLYYASIVTRHLQPAEQFPSLSFFTILSILAATALFYFSIVLGGFVVRRVLDQESDFTLQIAFNHYSRLFAIPLFLTAVASFFAFFGGVRFAGILSLLSMAIFALGNLFVISKPSKTSNLDPFYRFLLAVLLDDAILLPFLIAELSLTVDYLRILTFF